MGIDTNRFRGGQVDEELMCPICSEVFEAPVQAPVCEHAFCSACIKEWLSRGRLICPVDRQECTVKQLQPAPRILKNLLGRLEISCDNSDHGCESIVKLDSLPYHLKECEFNPKRPVSCVQGCGLTVAKDEMKAHNCVKELRCVVKAHEQKMAELEQSLRDCQYQLAEQGREISILKDLRNSNLPPASGSTESRADSSMTFPWNRVSPLNMDHYEPATSSNEHRREDNAASRQNPRRTLTSRMQEADAIVNWCNSLPRAKVTRWGGMISTPDPELQAQIRRCLIESGIPDTGQLLDDLMANAHERRWPPGLLTLETRQMNRRQYEQYVCRRVPGRQAVVVMACDNAHMSDDMIIEPGIVMIFAHGIE